MAGGAGEVRTCLRTVRGRCAARYVARDRPPRAACFLKRLIGSWPPAGRAVTHESSELLWIFNLVRCYMRRRPRADFTKSDMTRGCGMGSTLRGKAEAIVHETGRWSATDFAASAQAKGLLERRRYSEHPPRYEYLPTERARAFRPTLWMFHSWGNRHFAPEGPSVLMVDRRTGRRADPIVVDRLSGRPIGSGDFEWIAGPAADERTRRRPAGGDTALAQRAHKTARKKRPVPRAGVRRNA